LIGVLFMASGASLPARAGCSVSDPIPYELAENNEYYAVLCGLGWGGGGSVDPCPRPTLPVADSSRDHAQGLVVSATVPANSPNAHAVWWDIAYEAGGGTFVPLWSHRSTDGIPAEGLAPGTTVTFGAPGLVIDDTHFVRVSFEDENGEKLCWSNFASMDTHPLAVDDPSYDAGVHGSVSPAPPSGTYWRVEEIFDRPDTEPRCEGYLPGDGIGPDAVWSAYSVNPQTLCPELDANAGYFPQGTGARYEAEEAGSPFASFAEALVRVDLTRPSLSKYNFQVETKITEPAYYECVDATVIRSSAAKLVYGPRGCSVPTLFLARGPEQYGMATCVDADGDGTSEPIDPDFGIVCPDFPPLDVEDPQNPGTSEPVWLRVVARPVGDDVELRATAAWDCPDPGPEGVPPIEECQTCTFLRLDEPPLDPDDPCQPITDEFGNWGMGFHERWYFVDTFRAGDAGAAP
jgi:hypothetical protein